MNDQELLTYAAKAAGYDLKFSKEWHDKDDPQIRITRGKWVGRASWNPLENDADAFQLMVKLNLFVCVEDHEVEIFQNMNPDPLSGESLPDPRGKDFVVRKCIVVAAAEIGKGM